MNRVTPDHLKTGALWLFTLSRGRGETKYVFHEIVRPAQAATDKTPGLSAICTLRNPDTEGLAWVTEKWLREGQRPNTCGHWTPLEIA